MATRFYLLPIEVISGARGPKYLKWRFASAGMDVPWSMMDYGLQDTALVCADVTAGQHTTLSGNADVVSVPTNIDGNVTAGALSAVRASLESLWIPGNWVTTSHTYRQVLRVVAGLFQFAQRHHALHGEMLMQGAVNFNLTLGDLSAARRDRINATATSFGYDTSGFTLASTLRDVLKFLGDAWGSSQFVFGNLATL